MKLLALTVAFALAPATLPFQEFFVNNCKDRWLDRAAQCKQESGFNPRAQSFIVTKDGRRVPCASGLMQFTDPTWQTAIKNGWAPAGSSPLDPETSIIAGHRYMLALEKNWTPRMSTWVGTYEAALASYNAGEGSIKKADFLAKQMGLPGDGAWKQTLVRVTGINHGTGRPHAEETTGYVVRIAQHRAEFAKRFGGPK